MATISRSLVAANSFSCNFNFDNVLLRAHVLQQLIVLYRVLAMCEQRRSLAWIRKCGAARSGQYDIVMCTRGISEVLTARRFEQGHQRVRLWIISLFLYFV